MAIKPAYDGKISVFQISLDGDKANQNRCELANWIFDAGKKCAMQKQIDKNSKKFQSLLRLIDDVNSANTWHKIEDLVLNGVEKYLKNENKYDYESLEICHGTTMYLSAVYENITNNSILQRERLASLNAKAEKAKMEYKKQQAKDVDIDEFDYTNE